MTGRISRLRAVMLVALLVAPYGQVRTSTAQDLMAEPWFGTYYLVSGYVPDPMAMTVYGGGPVDSGLLGLQDPTGGECRGFIAPSQPDVRVHYVAGGQLPLRFYVQSLQGGDTTLLVNLPDASWRCNDDTVGLNPVIDVESPPSGQYDIWIGTYAPIPPEPAFLFVTELTTNGPEIQ